MLSDGIHPFKIESSPYKRLTFTISGHLIIVFFSMWVHDRHSRMIFLFALNDSLWIRKRFIKFIKIDDG